MSLVSTWSWRSAAKQSDWACSCTLIIWCTETFWYDCTRRAYVTYCFFFDSGCTWGILAAFTRDFSIHTNIPKRIHYFSEESWFLFQLSCFTWRRKQFVSETLTVVGILLWGWTSSVKMLLIFLNCVCIYLQRIFCRQYSGYWQCYETSNGGKKKLTCSERMENKICSKELTIAYITFITLRSVRYALGIQKMHLTSCSVHFIE
jgi:hypothetical protein